MTDPAGLDAAASRVFASPSESGGVDVVLFTGEWCPDCRRVSPAVLSWIESGPLPLGAPRALVCEVPRDVWKGPASASIRATWNVPCLPCLVRFDTRTGTATALEDAQPKDVPTILLALVDPSDS